MACNCGAKYDNKVPCCCSQGSPLVCTTTTCADAQICNQTIESNCVIYTGPNIECSGVTTGMTVTQVMDIILDGVNLINCSYCWSMDNSLSSDYVDAEYVNSDGETVPLSIEPYTVAQVCGRSVNTYISTLVPVNLGRCSVCFPTTTTTTSIPNVRCTFLSVLGQPGDYRIERFWDNLTTDPLTSEPFTFVLYDFTVDGVDYSNAETLIISLSSDLVTGVGLDGGTYVMNINDWLNTVAPQGFVCHDDMKVIEHPQGSTYSIRIRRINNSGTLDYFYSSTYGFAYGEQANTYGTYQCLPHSISTTTTTIIPITPTARCIGGDNSGSPEGSYYLMEKDWNDPTYTLTLNSMVLDGIEYANGEVLTITGPGDLVTGVSTVDGLTYVMNINDWLNNISGVSNSGFVFHDNMHAIDKPDVGTTFKIEIHQVNPNTDFTYWWSDQYGFSGGLFSDVLGNYTCNTI
jgi:hypothetical protein